MSLVDSEGLYDEHPDFMGYYERFIGNSAARLRIGPHIEVPGVALTRQQKVPIRLDQGFSGTAGTTTSAFGLRSFHKHLLEQVATFHAGVCAMVG